jgi:hypothetical protein
MIGAGFGSGGDPAEDNLLGFSADEQTLVTGGPDSTARFWRAPAAGTSNDPSSTDRQSIWPPAGDAVAVATPDATTIVIGDRYGNVHMVPAGDGPEAFLATEEVVSFLGHRRKIRMLNVSANGRKVVSAADDNSVRVWNTETGLPQSFFGEVSGNPIERMLFSPDASMIGILSSNRIQILDASDGSVLALFELGGPHQSMAFADSNHLYIGSESGTLRVVTRENGETWNLQTLWQGSAAIRWLEASPQSRFLTFVDQNDLAQQFILGEGKLGELALQLAGKVQDVTYSPSGSRVLLRTSRWIHRASSAAHGLIWLDAVLAPRSISASRMVFGDMSSKTAAPLGNRVFVPVSGDGFVQLAELNFDASRGPALFGNKEKLLEEWRHRFAAD